MLFEQKATGRPLDLPMVSVSTACRLLDGLISYRAELGETGRQLEKLLRLYGVRASTDLPCSRQVH
ncbi:MAG: hypothetical protein R3E95_16460 [Thiolinea sp.]